jgi:excisionase family DNA binding protein
MGHKKARKEDFQVLEELKGVGTRDEVDSPLMDVRGLSALTGLSIGTLYHWVSQKRIPIVRFSARCVRFRRSDIEAWIASRVVQPERAEMP